MSVQNTLAQPTSIEPFGAPNGLDQVGNPVQFRGPHVARAHFLPLRSYHKPSRTMGEFLTQFFQASNQESETFASKVSGARKPPR